MTSPGSEESRCRSLMEHFAARTGLSPDGVQRRYLWTDAFALCNYLTLLQRTGDPVFRDLSVRLIDRVHHVLGRHRADDPRSGWISGLDEAEGERHPTVGGLRIGKEGIERQAGEPYDPRSEWDRDGQYYHYLVRWMHALARGAEILEEPVLHRWAVELGQGAFEGFTSSPPPGGSPRMYWKMSIDLTRPLVSSQGAHDPLTGFVISTALGSEKLRYELDGLWSMCQPATWVTDDPLGIGGLLTDTWLVAQLLASRGDPDGRLEPLLLQLLEASLRSLAGLGRSQVLSRPVEERLAFRELGLVIGLRASEALGGAVEGVPREARAAVRALGQYSGLWSQILEIWQSTAVRALAAWKAHEDINDVMLATALTPDESIRV